MGKWIKSKDDRLNSSKSGIWNFSWLHHHHHHHNHKHNVCVCVCVCPPPERKEIKMKQHETKTKQKEAKQKGNENGSKQNVPLMFRGPSLQDPWNNKFWCALNVPWFCALKVPWPPTIIKGTRVNSIAIGKVVLGVWRRPKEKQMLYSSFSL